MKKNKLIIVAVMTILALSPKNTKAFLLDAVDLIGQVDGNGNSAWDQSLSYNGEAGPTAQGVDPSSFSNAGLLVVEKTHQLFAVDTNSNRILVFNLDGNNNLIDRTADYVLGQVDFISLENPNPPTASSLSGARGLAYDIEKDYLFVADTGNRRVLVFDVSGGVENNMDASYVLGQSDFFTVEAIAAQNRLGKSARVGI